jgi:hypothetical protein
MKLLKNLEGYLLVSDPLKKLFYDEELAKSRVYSLVSSTYSYINQYNKGSVGIKSFTNYGEKFNLDIIDVDGRKINFFGYINHRDRKFSGRTQDVTSEITVCFQRDSNLDENVNGTAILYNNKKPNNLYVKNGSSMEEVEIVNFYPFPYYKDMPLFEAFNILKAIMGTSGRFIHNDLQILLNNEISRWSLGLSAYELWESLKKLIQTGLDAGILKEYGNGIGLIYSKMSSRSAFMKNFYRFYERVNKTTLYDF